jgi:hypothetical protein
MPKRETLDLIARLAKGLGVACGLLALLQIYPAIVGQRDDVAHAFTVSIVFGLAAWVGGWLLQRIARRKP